MTTIAILLLNLILGDQPYILTVDHVTPFLSELCQASNNCMDIEAINQVDHCESDRDCNNGFYCGSQKACVEDL